MKESDRKKIDRYIKCQSDDVEKECVESMFLSNEKNLYLYNSIQDDWDSFLTDTSTKKIDLSYLLDRIHHDIRRNESSKMSAPLQRLSRIYIKIAAILLLPLLIAGGVILEARFFNNNHEIDVQSNSTIICPLGSRVHFSLPDGTNGMLNSGSQLSYTLPFTKRREIALSGEAWFDVMSDEKHPFTITAGNSTIKVLGTIFNLSAYPSEDYVEVVLQEGKVEFLNNISNEKTIILPKERLILQNGGVRKSTIDPIKYNSWTEGKLIFRGDPMEEVARRIERWYNIKVEIRNPELLRYSFRATFDDDNIEDVLKYLAMTSPITYKVYPREMLPDGSFKKQLVIIDKRF